MPTRKTRRSQRRPRKSRRRTQRKQEGGAWLQPMQAEAATIQALANSMDKYNAPYLISGSTAVATYIHELLTTDVGILDAAEVAEGQRVFDALKKPDDLDFKYRSQGNLFGDHIQGTPAHAPVSSGVSLNFSFIQSQSQTDCEQYIDLAGFRCCDPFEESPIFYPRGKSLFSKLEFHSPHEFKRKRMHSTHIAGIDMLGIQDLLTLYTSHIRPENAPKIAAIAYIQQIIERYPQLAEKYHGVN